MATSWDKDVGTQSRFDCGGDLGDGAFTPNCFVGTSLTQAPNNIFPTVPIGTADFTFEFWVKMLLFTTYNSDVQTLIGVSSNVNWVSWTNWILVYVRAGFLLLEFFDGAVVVNSPLIPVPPGWHHVVVEVQRGVVDTARTFIDGILVDTTSIVTVTGSIGTAGTARFTPYATDVTPIDVDAEIDPGTAWPDSLTDPFTDFNFYHQPAIIGPIALHLTPNVVLTAAQLQDSIIRRDLQDLSGTAILYRWKEIREVLDWERNPRHIVRGYSDFVRRPGAPKGTQGQVVVPDMSGNARTFTLQVFEDLVSDTTRELVPAYGQAPLVATPVAGQRARVAFTSDAFFQTGGGVPGGAA